MYVRASIFYVSAHLCKSTASHDCKSNEKAAEIVSYHTNYAKNTFNFDSYPLRQLVPFNFVAYFLDKAFYHVKLKISQEIRAKEPFA